ncbi:lipopolysaccharide biosynthesis protein [Arthrobacter sp. GMC3]|uniref:lipopolysaccharide biosynthesis protein n=1 Tax=Arthrobacter sp. GMC3 TaxID=2058894 RepID=UPI002157EBFD|nr:lipopolysaccharide biosynthesis protein [Arthrobacter sp. GMC3]
MSDSEGLGGAVRKGLVWSSINSLVLRMGSLVVGIVLARILAPEQFGVYALALTVQAILMALADLGLSADLIRSENPKAIAPTVATLGAISGITLSLTMAGTAPFAASMLGSPESAGVISVLSLTLLLAGLGVVPYATLSRRFEQRKLFTISLVDFAISTTITLALIFSGWGVMALAVGRICAQLSTLILQYWFAGERPRFGWDRIQVRPVLAFGLPVAGANLLSWALLNIDNVAVSRMAGPMALGFYVLAFNISSWPMNALGQAIRAVALPAFAQTARAKGGDRSFEHALALTWAVALPAGVLLAVVAGPVVALLYGNRWEPAVPILQALGLFGSFRAAFDLAASFLTARGATRDVFWVQVAWFLVLIPAIVLGIMWFGLPGAGWSHVAVGVLVAAFYSIALRRNGVSLVPLWNVVWPPLLAVIPASAVAWIVASSQGIPVLGVLLSGFAGLAIYGLLMFRWILRRMHLIRQPISENFDESALERVLHDKELGV